LLGRTHDVVGEELPNDIKLMATGGGNLGRGGQFRDESRKYDIFVLDTYAGCSRRIMESLPI
jgi:hypothetical protein